VGDWSFFFFFEGIPHWTVNPFRGLQLYQ